MTIRKALRDHDADERVDGWFAVERELRALLDRRLKPCGLTYAQFALLRFICEPRGADGKRTSSPVRAVDIAHYFGFAPRTVTIAVDGLVDLKYVKRIKRSTGDRRTSDIVPDDAADSVLACGKCEYEKVVDVVIQQLKSKQQLNATWHMIPNVLDNIDRQHRIDALKKRRKL